MKGHDMITFDHPDPDVVGFLPDFWSEDDPRSAKEQADANYQHGGGWRPISALRLHGWPNERLTLRYPGDPLFHEVARAKMREETIVLFSHDFVAIIQPDGSFEASRMD